MQGWFDVDKEGLAKLIAGKPKAFIIYELLQNAWDEDTTEVVASFTYGDATGEAGLIVEDDNPEGFQTFAHAWTLFAESHKKGNVRQRGRFNMGEKLVLALATSADIITTTGGVRFDARGRRPLKRRRETGSMVHLTIPMTLEEFEEALEAVDMLIPPTGITTIFNGEILVARKPALTFTEQLATEYAGEDGILKPTWRKAEVELYEPGLDEEPHIYEMGIPVVALEGGDQWHVNVTQKVPLNMNRDNVTPAYRRALRVHVLNHAHDLITEQEEATRPWIKEAASDKRCSDEAVTKTLDLRYGKKRVAYDPSDPEANKLAVARGYSVVSGGSLSKGEWDNAKRAGAIPAAGKVTPSPKVLSDADSEDDDYPEANITDDMRRVMAYASCIGEALLGHPVRVRLANRFGEGAAAWYGKPGLLDLAGRLTFNVANLGKRWFQKGNRDEDLNRLLIHEFAHDICGDHLDDDYHQACCRLGARLANLAFDIPEHWECTAADWTAVYSKV